MKIILIFDTEFCEWIVKSEQNFRITIQLTLFYKFIPYN